MWSWAELTTELPAHAGAIHPQGKAWAWAGRGSRLAIRSIEDVASETALSGSGKLIDTGKGKFGMAVEFVSPAQLVGS